MTNPRIEAFVREGRDGITELNNGLLALENDPDDDEAMEGIFRTAHTLKGNFAALGFEGASDLAHALEDLLDGIREGPTDVTPEVMDLLFAAVDRIEAIIDEIDETGEPQSGPGDLHTQLRDAIGTDAASRGDDSGGAGDSSNPDAAADGDGTGEAGSEHTSEDGSAPDSGVALAIETGGAMPGVDGSIVLDAFEDDDAPELIETTPDSETIREGEFEERFELVVAGDSAATAEFVTGLQPVESVEVLAAADTQAASTEAQADAAASEPDVDEEPDADEEPDVDEEPGADEEDDADEPVESTNNDAKELSSIRIDVDQLDEIHSLVEQLVTSRIKLRRAVEEADADTARDPLKELDKISSALQDTVMDLRLIPLDQVVDAFPRLVRDLAREEGKEVDFEMTGTDIELDRRILNQIGDPLIHILRNAVDHGIEPPEEREAAGKDRRGRVELRASRDRDQVLIAVEDNGGGLDHERIKSKAIDKGLYTRSELDSMSRSAIYDLVYESGFSTAEEVDDVSGRGVGMDVVNETVNRLDGSVSVESAPGEGTLVEIRLPVTAAIAKMLFVEVGSEEYGIPIKDVDEVDRLTDPEIVDGEEVIEHNEDIYPVIGLAESFEVNDAATNGDGVVIRVPPEQRRVALQCDAVTEQEEVVIRPATGILGDVDGLSGTTVVGDGNVVPILDVNSI